MNVELSLPFQYGQEPDPRLFINLHTTPHELQQLINEALMAKNHFFKKANNLIIIQQLSGNNSEDLLFLHYQQNGNLYHLRTFKHGKSCCFEPIEPENWPEGSQITFKNEMTNIEKSFPLKFQNMIQSQL